MLSFFFVLPYFWTNNKDKGKVIAKVILPSADYARHLNVCRWVFLVPSLIWRCWLVARKDMWPLISPALTIAQEDKFGSFFFGVALSVFYQCVVSWEYLRERVLVIVIDICVIAASIHYCMCKCVSFVSLRRSRSRSRGRRSSRNRSGGSSSRQAYEKRRSQDRERSPKRRNTRLVVIYSGWLYLSLKPKF